MTRKTPHQSLGMLYLATLLQPSRDDYAFDYFTAWLLVDRNEMLIEGVNKYGVPIMACKASMAHPQNNGLREMSKLMVKTFTGDEEQKFLKHRAERFLKESQDFLNQ